MLNEFSNPFKSFWMAGYECADHLNNTRNRVDLAKTTGHLDRLKKDYEDLSLFNITTVREGIRWSQVEKTPYKYDFNTVKMMLQCAKSSGIQQVWDVCHFGFPDDLDPLHPDFTKRFVSLCAAFTQFYKNTCPDQTLIVTPINEVSFLSWLGGDVRGTSPFRTESGFQVKYKLMEAYIQSIYKMKEIDPTIRILTTEPLVNIIPPLRATKEKLQEAAMAHNNQYQAVDMLAGHLNPELGGSPELLDLLGFNYYYNNQWAIGFSETLDWKNKTNDLRWRSFSSLMTEAYERYKKPVVLAETSHFGVERPLWIKIIAKECKKLLEQNIPLYGICIYPIIDRPDWDHLDVWHASGVWDKNKEDHTIPFTRILNEPYANALKLAQKEVERAVLV